MDRISEFEEIIDYKFKDKNLIFTALSHSSFINENRKHHKSNERLEFLGDSVLSVIVSDYIFEHYTFLPEGELTKIRASLVCEKALFKFAKQIKLGEYIMLGKGEESTGGRNRPSVISDAFEAVIAAIYLDGGLEVARKYVLRFIPKDFDPEHYQVTDYKTILQEVIQRNPEEIVEYVLKDEKGPDHKKQFTVQVMLNSNVIGEGIGKNKKNAEQMAAKQALDLMGYET